MKIMSESEFQKCIEDAERRGYEKATHDAYVKQEERDFQNSVWRDMREFRQAFVERLERLEKATGNEYVLTKNECCCVAPPPGV